MAGAEGFGSKTGTCRPEACARRLTSPGAERREPVSGPPIDLTDERAAFSRRFKDRYGLSPRDDRHRALSQAVPCRGV
jgi:AraC family transcriptional activator of tynA and feaB